MTPARTLGVEEELQVIDAATSRLASRAPQLLSRLPADYFAAELQRSTVEINTGVFVAIDDLRLQVQQLRAQAVAVAADVDLGLVAAGTTPLSSAADLQVTAGGRFDRMQDDYRLLVDEHLVCGLQVHVGVDDRDLAVRCMQRLEPALPTLLALSVSSPFWERQDTGYASMRTMLWQRWPSAGATGPLASAEEYDRLVANLVASGVITDSAMAYFDVRPSAHLPTLELRVCDSCPLVDDVVLIAALFRAAVEAAAQAELDGVPFDIRPAPLHRAAMWRAARSGCSHQLLGGGAEPVSLPAAEVVTGLVEDLRPQLEETGDWDTVRELTAATLARGTSSQRQQFRFAERGRLSDVVQLLVDETSGRSTTQRARTRWSAGYRASSVDEAVDATGAPFPTYLPVFEVLEQFDPTEMSRLARGARGQAVERDLTFGVDGEQRPFPVDLVPRVIPAHEWAVLAAGLTQRARAIEAYLRDAYGPAQLVADGVMMAATLSDCPGWRPEGRALPEEAVRAPVIGFDLVRDTVGGWRVLEDNARVPSGIGYAIGVRRLMGRVMPELSAAARVRDPDEALALLGTTLRACSPRPHPEVALLSEGADNSGWYEHRLLADEVGLLLAQPSEVEFEGGDVVVGGRRVDVLYLRCASELVDLRDGRGRPVGAQVLDAAHRGNVVVVNAPGNGIADDKSMYCHIPDLISYYLHERALLASVPTYRCANTAERSVVLDRIDELVTKPVDGYGGAAVLIGPAATAAQLDRRRLEIIANPGAWIAQEVVALSTLPTLVDGRLEPRHVDLRAFVYLTGTGAGQAHLAGLALTRVAPAGSMVVNSSRGGGAKDTWILLSEGDSGNPSDERRNHVRIGR